MKSKMLLLALLVACQVQLSAQNTTKANWNQYTGSHYDKEVWSGWVRDYARKLGSYMLDSGKVFGQIDTNLINGLFNDMLTLPVQYDATLQPGAMGGDTQRMNLYMSRLDADTGATWREVCKLQALKLAGLPNGKDRIFWQVGNEISSHSYSQIINTWAGNPVPCSGNGCDYDLFIIPVYAERFFAPTVQGIREASMQLYGSKDSINIILGSVTNAGSNPASKWLDSLMNYTIAGTFAPDLAGKKIYELIDIISIHYMMGNSGANAWRAKIDGYRDKWFNVAKVRGIWSTEEVGIAAATNGYGAARGAAATARYLEWAAINGYTPYQCRTNYYAYDQGPTGSTVNDLNAEIYNFLGNVPLTLLDSGLVKYDNPDIESHAFITSDSTKAIIYTLLASAPPQPGAVSTVQILKNGMGKITGATTHHFGPSGHQTITPIITAKGDTFFVGHENSGCA